jgi:hypothetical protein
LAFVYVALIDALAGQLHAGRAQVAIIGAHVVDPARHAGSVQVRLVDGGLHDLRLANSAEVEPAKRPSVEVVIGFS